MIPPNELDGFREALVSVLRQYTGRLAVDIGATALLGFADYLNTKQKLYEAALSSYSAKGPSDRRPEAVRRLNSHIDDLAVLVQQLALLVGRYGRYSESTRPGELSGSSSDLTTLRGLMKEVKESIDDLTRTIDDTKKVLVRRSGGSFKSGPKDGGNRSYRLEPIAAANEYR